MVAGSIPCGRCHKRHPSVEDVRACYNGEANVPVVEYDIPKSRDRATPEQVGFLGRLLTRNNAHITSGVQLDQLAKRGTGSVSDFIDRMLDYEKSGGVPQGITITVSNETLSTKRHPLPDIPAGYYATPSATGNNDLDFWRVKRPTKGQWKGRTFVDRVIGGKPDKSVRVQSQRAALEAIEALGIDKSAKLYAKEIGRCSRCNRHLTDKVSRSVGMGPECRSR